MRLFISIDLNDEIRSRIDKIESEMASKNVDVRFVEPKNIHITLKFLGEVGEDGVNNIVNKVSECVKHVKQFKLGIEGFGYFGTPKHVKILWIDVKEGREELIKLIESLNKRLEHIRRENHKPSPHITIGRVSSGRNREALLDETERLKHVKLGELNVNEIVLKKSTLTSSGPVYEDVKVFRLA
jgi:2'-5' RNA ligase